MTATARPALPSDLPRVAEYLSRRLAGGGPARYRRFFEYTWPADAPNIGVLLEEERQVRGFLGALYASRRVGAEEHPFCNISSWAVDDEHRKMSLTMLKRLLAPRDHTFTCFSPSKTVVELLAFFKFKLLESTKVILSPLSGAPALLRTGPGTVVTTGPALERRLDQEQRRLYRDHRGYRLGHFLVERGEERCYLVTGRRGRDVRAFADVLHVDNVPLFLDALARLSWPLFRAHGTLLVGLDRRHLARLPPLAYASGGLRPVQWRSPTLGPSDIDALYTEIVPILG
jgi:hypothetical protein